jgi:hypothetical protein
MSTPWERPGQPPAGSLREMLDQYVAMRRRLGYKFQHQGRMLTAFVEYLEQRGETTITVAPALAWVAGPQRADHPRPAPQPVRPHPRRPEVRRL